VLGSAADAAAGSAVGEGVVETSSIGAAILRPDAIASRRLGSRDGVPPGT